MSADSTATSITRDEVRAVAANLHGLATRYVEPDWVYTRDLGDLQPLRYTDTRTTLPRRLKEVTRRLFTPRRTRDWERDLRGATHELLWRLMGARSAMRSHLYPADGVLTGSGLIVGREESGEYVQYVQPSVGELLADLMAAHPDLPEVRVLAAEMKRIEDAYLARIAGQGGEADGCIES